MPKTLKYSLPLIIVILLGLFLWQGLKQDPSKLPSTLIGKPAPAFKLPTLLKPNTTLSNKDFQGHVSIFNVWASWCNACLSEHVVLTAIAKHTHIPLYGLSYKDTRKAATTFLKKYGDPYAKVAMDPQGNTGINWGVYGTPETYIIDKRGIVRYKYIGPLTFAAWHDDLLPIVKKLQAE